MNCHYSCATCSAAVYMHKCLSCPSTRVLTTSTCPCLSGYYEAQTQACYSASQASIFMQLVLPIADALFYTNIALFWLYIIMIFCRVNSSKIRIVINFSQGFALLLSYPFLFEKLSSSFLQTLLPFNFSYFNSILACSSDICLLFSYIWQPLLVFPCIFGCFLISYFLMSVCYRSDLTSGLGFVNYTKQTFFFILFCFFDWTALKFGQNFGKAVRLSTWAWIFVGVFGLMIIVVGWKLFRILNSQEQTKILYRAKNSWAYGYDENYHLHYIDFLYSQARRKVPQPEQQTQQFPQTQNSIPPALPSPPSTHIKLFIPHSNLYIFQLFFKYLLGFTSMLLYQSSPIFITYSLVILLVLFMIWLGTFAYYDKLNLLLYLSMAVALMLFVSVYWMSFFWLAAMVIAFFVTGVVGVCFIVLFFVNSKIKGKLIQKMFEQQQDNKKVTDVQELSQEEMNIKNMDAIDKQHQYKPENTMLSPLPQPAKKTTLEPFMGNLTRKTKPNPNKNKGQTQLTGNTQTEDLLKTYQGSQVQPNQNKKGKPKKQIFSDSIRQNSQQNEDASSPKDNVIKHSKFQSKMNQVKTKVSAKNKTKNVFDLLIQDEDQGKNSGRDSGKDRGLSNQIANGQNQGNNLSAQPKMQKARATAKSALDSGQNKNKARITQDEDFLSNVLQQPKQQIQRLQKERSRSTKKL